MEAPRRAVTTDGPAIAELIMRTRAASAPSIPPGVHPPPDVYRWVQEVVLAEHEVWVADPGAGPIAVMVLTPGWLDQLYVDPDHQNLGLGSSLVRLAQHRQPEGLALWTFAANVGARRFYQRHGFVEEGGTDGDNEEGAPDVRLRWVP